MTTRAIKDAVVSFFQSKAPGTLLDIPCGNMWLGDLLVELGYQYWGCDLYRAPSHIEKPGAVFCMADMNDVLPFRDKSFDYIACIEGIEHVESTHHVVKELARILRPGGKIVLTTPNILNISSRFRFFLRGTYFGFPHLIDLPRKGEHAHINPVNLSFLNVILKKNGLKMLRILKTPWKRRYLKYLPLWLIVKVITHIGLSSADHRKRELHRLLMSKELLLRDSLVLAIAREMNRSGVYGKMVR